MASGQPIQLDRRLPFVQAVLSLDERANAVDSAARLLRDIELKHGIEILRDLESSSLGAGSFRPRDSLNRTYRELLNLVDNWGLFQEQYEFDGKDDDSGNLHPFLSETEFVIQGMDFTNAHFIRCANGTIHCWTQRAWGQELADWANATGWGPHFNKRSSRCAWDYVDFYISLTNHVIQDYELWRDNLLRVISRKCELQLESDDF